MNGKPRIVSQRYLGSAEDIIAALDGARAVQERTRQLLFGDLAAVWWMLHRLGYAQIVDGGGRRAPFRRGRIGGDVAGVSDHEPGRRALLEARLRRLVGRHRRRPVGRWTQRRIGPPPVLGRDTRGLRGCAGRHRTHSRGPDGRRVRPGPVRDGVGHDELRHVHRLGQRPGADRPTGHTKQKRTDLRLVCLGMVVTRDGGIPLVGHAYPGNRPDVAVFPAVVDEVLTRCRALAAADQELTVVFDAGQNSAAYFTHLAQVGLHFIGSLPPSDYPQLLAFAARRRRAVEAERYPGLTALEFHVDALGAQRRVLLTHSPTLAAKQAAGFDQTLSRATRALNELANVLARGRARRDRAGVEAEITRITRARWLTRILLSTLTGEESAELRLAWQIDELDAGLNPKALNSAGDTGRRRRRGRCAGRSR